MPTPIPSELMSVASAVELAAAWRRGLTPEAGVEEVPVGRAGPAVAVEPAGRAEVRTIGTDEQVVGEVPVRVRGTERDDVALGRHVAHHRLVGGIRDDAQGVSGDARDLQPQAPGLERPCGGDGQRSEEADHPVGAVALDGVLQGVVGKEKCTHRI